MKVWHEENGTEETLCDHGREGPSSFVPQVVRKKEILSFVQGVFAKPRSRGNTYRVWSFSVSKEHATTTAAQEYLLTLNQAVPADARIWIELEDQETRYVCDAVIEIAPAPHVGVRTTVSYTLTFGMVGRYVYPARLASSDGTEINSIGGIGLLSPGHIEWEDGTYEKIT